jgi:hypothetical protein
MTPKREIPTGGEYTQEERKTSMWRKRVMVIKKEGVWKPLQETPTGKEITRKTRIRNRPRKYQRERKTHVGKTR